MKPNEIREMTAADIERRIEEETAELTHMRFQHAVAPLQNPMLLRQKRRDIARLKTVLRQKQTA